MKRRDFLKYLLATPLATELDVEKLLWVPNKKIFVFASPIQERFYGYGIPYHENNASTGQWLGIPRGAELYFDIAKLVKILEEDKRMEPLAWDKVSKNG
jgi:hypothetical protein